jgi:hypothetical protein
MSVFLVLAKGAEMSEAFWVLVLFFRSSMLMAAAAVPKTCALAWDCSPQKDMSNGATMLYFICNLSLTGNTEAMTSILRQSGDRNRDLISLFCLLIIIYILH